MVMIFIGVRFSPGPILVLAYAVLISHSVYCCAPLSETVAPHSLLVTSMPALVIGLQLIPNMQFLLTVLLVSSCYHLLN